MVLADVVLHGLDLVLLAACVCFVIACVLAVIGRAYVEAFIAAGGTLAVLALLLG